MNQHFTSDCRSNASVFIPGKSTVGNALTLAALGRLCDDPKRDQFGGVDVRAVLAFSPEDGFYLSAQDGPLTHLVVDADGKQMRFRTIEAALERLGDVAGLSPEIGIVQLAQASERHGMMPAGTPDTH